MDDGSTDRSLEIVREHVAHDASGRLRVVSQSNQGVCKARNYGASLASVSSKYLLFLDSDDLLFPNMLINTVNYLNRNSSCSAVYVLYRFIDQDGNITSDAIYWPRYQPTLFGLREISIRLKPTPTFSFLNGITIPSSMLIRKQDFDESGGFDETLSQPLEDLDFFVRLSLSRPVHCLPIALTLYRQHNLQVTSDTSRLEQERKALFQRWLQEPSNSACRELVLQYKARMVPLIWLRSLPDLLKDGRVLRALALLSGTVSYYAYYSLLYLLHSR